MWFVGGKRTDIDTWAEELAVRVARLESEADQCANAMAEHEREHADLEGRLHELQAELDAVRKEQLDAYARWWHARERQNRALHLSRRLRRRLHRVRRRRRPRGPRAGR